MKIQTWLMENETYMVPETGINDSQGDDDDNNDNSADDKKVIYDFNEPCANMLEKYRKLDKITVLSAIYRSHYLQTIILDLMKNRHIFQIQKF